MFDPIKLFKEIKILFMVRKEVSRMSLSELKTSEGRAHVLGQIILIYSAIHGFIPTELATKISLIAFTVYTAVRGLVKVFAPIATLTPTPKDDAALAEAQKLLDVAAPKSEVK